METFEVNGKELNVSVRSSTRAKKTVNIQVKSEDDLVVTLPTGKDVNIGVLLKKHSELISQKYEAFLTKQKVLQGNRILYKGRSYHIKIRESRSARKEPVTVKDESIVIYTCGGEHPALLLKQWLMKQTNQLVEETVEKYSDSLDRKPSNIFVGDTSRWGYCKRNGEIIYNWQIAMLPARLAEYIVLHEIVHLSEFNHQKGFQHRLTNIMPDYKQRQRDLKRYSPTESISEIEKTAKSN